MNINIYAILVILLLLVGVAGTAGIDVKQYGAKGDGIVDDSAAIQKALDAASEKGGIVELGVGTFRLDNPISVPEGVTLTGVWEAPHHAMLTKGTVFNIYAGKGDENGTPTITLNPSSAIKGITFFYPEQRIPDIIKYPWTVRGAGMHCSVMDCTFVNPYRMLDFATNWNELHYIRNVFGCPLKVGVSVDKCSDIGRIENVHFNPHYWFRTELPNPPDGDGLIKFLGQNLIAFEFGRSDWEYVINTFVYGAKIGYRFYETKDGTVNGNFLGIGADWCGRAVMVEECQVPGLLITNGEFVGGDGTDVFVEIGKANTGVVQFSNCAFWGPCPTVARIDGKGTVSLNQCNFHNHGKPAHAFTIEGKGGDISIQGCRFGSDRPDIKLGKNVNTAIISTNRFMKKKEILNECKGDVAEGLNVVSK